MVTPRNIQDRPMRFFSFCLLFPVYTNMSIFYVVSLNVGKMNKYKAFEGAVLIRGALARS